MTETGNKKSMKPWSRQAKKRVIWLFCLESNLRFFRSSLPKALEWRLQNWNNQVRIYHLHLLWLRWLNTREGWFWSEEWEASMTIIICTLWPLRRQGASYGQEGMKQLENNKWWLDWLCKFLIITKLQFVWILYCWDHSICIGRDNASAQLFAGTNSLQVPCLCLCRKFNCIC